MADCETGEVDVRRAVIQAAVHGWYERHIEGEDTCPGCEHRGDDVGRGILREIWIQEALRGSLPGEEPWRARQSQVVPGRGGCGGRSSLVPKSGPPAPIGPWEPLPRISTRGASPFSRRIRHNERASTTVAVGV